MKITQNASLLPYNTFAVEAKTRFLVEIDSTEVLDSFLSQKTDDFPILFLGGGVISFLHKILKDIPFC